MQYSSIFSTLYSIIFFLMVSGCDLQHDFTALLGTDMQLENHWLDPLYWEWTHQAALDWRPKHSIHVSPCSDITLTQQPGA